MDKKRKRKNTGLPRNKKTKTDGEPPDPKDNRSRMQAFNSIVKEEYAVPLRELIYDRSSSCSQIMVLGSIQFQFMADRAYTYGNVNWFKDNDGSQVIGDCFRTVTKENIGEPHKLQMNPNFKALVESD